MKTQQENRTETDIVEIRRLADEFLEAYNASDLKRICGLLTEGSVLMPTNEPVLNGIEDIRSRFESFFTGFTFTIEFYPAETSLVGDLGFERGSYSASALLRGIPNEPKGGYGEYLLLFERANSQWKIGAFATAAVAGTPPGNIAGPERLADLMENAPAVQDRRFNDLTDRQGSGFPSRRSEARSDRLPD